jgi:hypothetical protein
MSRRPGIVNIVNFIRGVEPREPAPDLLEPVVNQMRLAKQYRLPVTWLLQYDALMEQANRFVPIVKDGLKDGHEAGAWLEIVQPLVEKAGLKWRGRFPWDWHSHVGFSIGYTPAERERLIDVFMADFQRVFGRYPQSVGSWFIDAHTLGYLADRYGVAASCNCKDQWGTDGYTLWGGYYNQAYYPSRRNAFVPAQNAAHQIPIPVFRMLGSDPIYQYDAKNGDGGGSEWQGVITLEPVYCGNGGGGDSDWVRWFFDAIFNTPCLSFGYTQAGQENPFGWPAMKAGLTFQMGLLAEKAAKGELRVETLARSAQWFRQTYTTTPASAIVALTDWQKKGRKSVWYCSRFYRTNLFWDNDAFWIRDIQRFDETYSERYLADVCTTPNCTYDALPVFDGYLWSGPDVRARLRPVEIAANGERRPLAAQTPVVAEQGESLAVEWQTDKGAMKIVCEPGVLRISFPPGSLSTRWGLEGIWSSKASLPVTRVEDKCLHYVHSGHAYRLTTHPGRFQPDTNAGSILLLAEDGAVGLHLA